MLIEIISILILTILLIVFPSTTPLIFILSALYFILTKYYTNNKLNILDDKSENLKKDLKVLYDNQQDLLMILKTIRTRINNFKTNGSNKETEKPSSIEDRLRTIRKREETFNSEE
jgi:hypothetical protein